MKMSTRNISQTKIKGFKIHKMNKAQYDIATKSENDLYLITDDVSLN